MDRRSKRGSEIVEAAIVLPLLILTLLSLICLTVFIFHSVKTQADMHSGLTEYIEAPGKPFFVRTRQKSESSALDGIVGKVMTKDISAHIYEINESEVLRGGKQLIGGNDEKNSGKTKERGDKAGK